MFKTLFALLFFAATIFAQGIHVTLPTANQTVVAGENITVQIQQPVSTSGWISVGIAFGLQSCPCIGPEYDMGNILSIEPYQPELYQPTLAPYENFTVTIPSSTPAGPASLNVAYFLLLGALYYPTMETANQTLTIVN